MINDENEKKMKTLCGQSKRHNMQCSFNLHWLLAAWGEGTGSELRGWGGLRWVGGWGGANWRTDWLGGAGGWGDGGKGVLQVTVQVKRQILSAVWRKALEVPTVQRERSSYVWNTSSAWFQGERVEVRVAAAGQQEGKVTKEKKRKKKKRKWRGLSPFHFPAHTTSRRRFHIYLEQRQFCGADVGTPGSGCARYVNSAAYDMTWRIAPPAVAAQRPYSALQNGPGDHDVLTHLPTVWLVSFAAIEPKVKYLDCPLVATAGVCRHKLNTLQ